MPAWRLPPAWCRAYPSRRSGRAGRRRCSRRGLRVVGLAIDSERVYWCSQRPPELLSAPLAGVPAGGAPTVVASLAEAAWSVAVGPSGIYFTTQSTVGFVPAGDPTTPRTPVILRRGGTQGASR